MCHLFVVDFERKHTRNWRNTLLAICVCVLAVPFIATPAFAEESLSDDWQFSVTPYLWALSMDGDVTVKGNKSHVDMNFSDIWEALNIALMAEAEVRKGRLGFFVNPLYAKLGDENDRLDVEVDMILIGFGGYYRFGPYPLESEAATSGPNLIADLYAGARYTSVKLDLKGKVAGLLDNDGDRDWFDPIVGVRTLWSLSPRWTLTAAGDVGGFGVGSDFQWMFTALVGYNFHFFGNVNAQVFAGYRALHQKYEDGSGSDEFKWDTTLQGPVLGLSVHF